MKLLVAIITIIFLAFFGLKKYREYKTNERLADIEKYYANVNKEMDKVLGY